MELCQLITSVNSLLTSAPTYMDINFEGEMGEPNHMYHHHLPAIIIVIIATNSTNPILIANVKDIYILLTMICIFSLHSLAQSSPFTANVSKNAKPFRINSRCFTSVKSKTCKHNHNQNNASYKVSVFSW